MGEKLNDITKIEKIATPSGCEFFKLNKIKNLLDSLLAAK